MTVYLAHTRKVHYVYLSVTPDCVQNNSRYLIGSLRHPLTVVSDMNVKTMQTLRANSQFMKLAPGPDTKNKQPVHEIDTWFRH